MKQLPDNFTIYGVNKTADIKNKAYSIEEVYEVIKDDMFVKRANPNRVMFDGDEIKANSQRLQLFYTKGFKCVECGTEGKFFVKLKNKHDNRYHLELVGKTPDGTYILMTKDHITPKSKGGRNTLENYQTMCVVCNMKKGNKIIN